MSRRLRAALAVTVGVLALVLLPAGLAQAADTESIPSYAAVVTLDKDGSMHVQETISYTFSDLVTHHGIYRDLRTTFAYDPSAVAGQSDSSFSAGATSKVRVYPVSDVHVSSPTGAPTDTKVTKPGNITDIRIGNPDRTVSGTQTYVIRYTVKGALNGFSDHQELYWNITGAEWQVPIESTKVTVQGPAAATKVVCYRGGQGSTETCSGNAGATSTFETGALEPGEGMTILLSYPLGTFSTTAPILQHTGIGRVLDVSPYAVGLSGLLIAGVGGLMTLLVWRRGRDEEYVGLTPGLAPLAGEPGDTQKVGLRHPEVAVQFAPPEGMRVGQLGTLIDEEANVVDVTATIIDLAVRGFLKIIEIPKEGHFSKQDWNLQVVLPAPKEELLPYEMSLMQAIFKGRNEVLLSGLKNTFAADMKATQARLYDDVTARGWFRGNPQTVRAQWGRAGLAAIVAGVALTWFGFSRQSPNLVIPGLGLIVGGLIARWMAKRMPARTAAGSAALAQANGFRKYLTTAEAGQIKFEEGQDIFSRYLPYAIVFGVADRWAGIFQQLAAQGANVAIPSWYVGYWAGSAFNFGGFGSAMDSFSTIASGALVSTPASSGSSGFGGGGGFSGGGGGGGGGGSW
jgi:uncharacterized protein (TIGR04222 family)